VFSLHLQFDQGNWILVFQLLEDNGALLQTYVVVFVIEFFFKMFSFHKFG